MARWFTQGAPGAAKTVLASVFLAAVAPASKGQLCTPPTISVQPSDQSVCVSGSASYTIMATGTEPLFYQWQLETAPEVWQGMGNDPILLPCGGGAFAFATPIDSPTVRVGIHPCRGVTHYRVRVFVTNDCGSIASESAALVLNTADFNNDGDVGTDADIEAFFACLAGNCCATCGTADFNGDGDTGTDADIEAFFRVLAGGSC